MPDPDGTRPEPTPNAALEQLLFLALERLDAGGAAAFEQFLAEHGAHAGQLRAHVRWLRRMGLADADADAGAAPTRPEPPGD
jgi:hypothetical protein